MSLAVRATYDTIRSLAHGSISGSYAALGAKLAFPARILKLVNNTDGDLLVSTDGSNDMDFLAANSFVLYDLATNRQVAGQQYTFPANTQFYIKQSSAPTKNSVYLVVVYALPQNPAPNNL